MSFLCDRIMKGFENIKGTSNPAPPSTSAFPVAGAKKPGMNRVNGRLTEKYYSKESKSVTGFAFVKRL